MDTEMVERQRMACLFYYLGLLILRCVGVAAWRDYYTSLTALHRRN